MLYVNNEFECFIRGSKHEKTVYMKHEREARVFYCFRVFGPLMKHEKRVVYITSQTKTFHWLFNLLSVIKILIVVF
jgi:hypothetical protein